MLPMSEIELLTRIEQKIDIFLQESMVQQSSLKAKNDIFVTALKSDNEYNKSQTDTAKLYLSRLMTVYQQNSLGLSDLFFAIADYCHSRKFDDLDSRCQELGSDSYDIFFIE